MKNLPRIQLAIILANLFFLTFAVAYFIQSDSNEQVAPTVEESLANRPSKERVLAANAGNENGIWKNLLVPFGRLVLSSLEAISPDSTSLDPLGIANLASIFTIQETTGHLESNKSIFAPAFFGSGSELVGINWEQIEEKPDLVEEINGAKPIDGRFLLLEGDNIKISSDELTNSLTISSTATNLVTTNSSSISLKSGAGILITRAGLVQTIINSDLGSSQNIFKNVAVSGQGNLETDTNSDTLTFAAGSNVTLTTDPASDTITISASGGGSSNADTLDSLDSLSFLRSDTSDNFTSGTLTFDAGTTLSIAGSFSCTNCVGDTAIPNSITVDAAGISGSLTDAQVSDTLTASNLVSGASVVSDTEVDNNITIDISGSINAGAVNSGALGNASVTLALGSFGSITGSLGDGQVADNISLDWAGLQSYPSGCSAGSAVTTIGDTLTCTSFTRAGVTESITGAWSFDNLTIADTTIVFSGGSSGLDLQGGGTTTLSIFNTTGGQIAGLSVEGVGAFGSFLATNSNLHLNFSGPDGNSFLYFYDNSSATSEYLSWNDSSAQFDLSDDLSVTGTFAASSTITGTTLNGTTGINTGAGAGTNRIDVSGNLVNIGTLSLSGDITWSATTPNIAVTNAETLTITDGTNTLFTLADGGTVGNLTISGTGTFSSTANPGLTIGNGTTGHLLLGGSTISDANGNLTLNSDSGLAEIVTRLAVETTPVLTDGQGIFSFNDGGSSNLNPILTSGTSYGIEASFLGGPNVSSSSSYGDVFLVHSGYDYVSLRSTTTMGWLANFSTSFTDNTIIGTANVITNYAGLRVRDPVLDISSLTITNPYGIYIENFGADGATFTNNPIAIYQAGTDDYNVFLGKSAFGANASGDQNRVLNIVENKNCSGAGGCTFYNQYIQGSHQTRTGFSDSGAYKFYGLYIDQTISGGDDAGVYDDSLTGLYVKASASNSIALYDRVFAIDAELRDDSGGGIVGGNYAAIRGRVTLDDSGLGSIFLAADGGVTTIGLQIEDLTGVSTAIYQAGSNDINTFNGPSYFNSAVAFGGQSAFPNNDTTPNVSADSSFLTNNSGSTLISDFDAGAGSLQAGHLIFVEHGDANTDYDCTASGLNCGSTDITTTAAGDFFTWYYDGADWHLVSFMDDSDNHNAGSGFDLAELFPSQETLLPGELVSIDPSGPAPGYVKKTSEAKDSKLLGVVSTNPGITLGEPADVNAYPIALAGRVPVKVSSENGAVETGDPLTSSSTPGVAMKATGSGPIIGKALEDFASSGTGEILVFIDSGWYVDPVVSSTVSDGLTDIDLENLTSRTITTERLIIGGTDISFSHDGLLVDSNLKVNGNLEVDGEVLAKVLRTDELQISSETSGTTILPSGNSELRILNSKVKESSKILITFTGDYSPATRFWTVKEAGQSFTVKLDQPLSTTAKFDWVIIN